jgi:hypothetical protein
MMMQKFKLTPYAVLANTTKQEFQMCFQEWKRHWVQCTNYEIGYCEGECTVL